MLPRHFPEQSTRGKRERHVLNGVKPRQGVRRRREQLGDPASISADLFRITFVVPKGVEQKPFAARGVKPMLIEPSGVVKYGNAAGRRDLEHFPKPVS